MNQSSDSQGLDDVLEILSKPLSRYILAILAGIDLGNFPHPDSLNHAKEKTEQSHH